MRNYKDRVEVWQSSPNPDGFGGNTLTLTKLGESWAGVVTLNEDKLIRFGLDIGQFSVILKLRYRADIDYHEEGIYFVYKGKKLIPNQITEIDMDGREFRIIATHTNE
jgi:head-tail adaptor